jgi:hypothetical protein
VVNAAVAHLRGAATLLSEVATRVESHGGPARDFELRSAHAGILAALATLDTEPEPEPEGAAAAEGGDRS